MDICDAMESTSRACPLCSAEKFEILSQRLDEGLTQRGIYLFNVVEGVCQDCGFIYTNPVPTDKSLISYYGDKYLHSVGSPDYDIEKRIAYLKRVAGGRKRLLEAGSGEGSFLSRAREIGFDAKGIEPNVEVQARKLAVGMISRKQKYEIIVAAHVLEHIERPLDWLKKLYASLIDRGLLILEVPNLHLYGKYTTGVFYEHLSHFSPEHLAYLVNQAGFQLLGFEHDDVSRPQGFTILAERREKVDSVRLARQYELNKRFYGHALKLIDERNAISRVFINDMIAQCEGGVLAVWGANLIMLKLLRMVSAGCLARIILVDENDRRWNDLLCSDIPLSIVSPECLRLNTSVKRIVICAIGWAHQIRESLQQMGYSRDQIRLAPV